MITTTYVFDGHTGLTDTQNVWTNEANLTDTSSTSIASTTTGGTYNNNNVLISGTNAPATGTTNIVQVRARINGSVPVSTSFLYAYIQGTGGAGGTVYRTGTGTGYGAYDYLTPPSGGWTWAAIRELTASVYASATDGTYNAGIVEIEVTTSTTTEGFLLGQTANTSNTQAYTTDRKLTYKFAATNNGVLSNGEAGMFAATTAVIPVRAVVYADNAGAPGALLAVSDDTSFSSTTAVRVLFTFSGANKISITAGTNYWIGVQYGATGGVSVSTRRANTASLVRGGNDAFSDGAANPFGTTATTNGGLDVFMFYKPPANPLATTVSDNFNDNTLTGWNYFGNIAETNGQLQATTIGASPGYSGVTKTGSYSLIGSSLTLQVVDAGIRTQTSHETALLAYKGNNKVWFLLAGTTLYAYKTVAGTGTSLASVTYNPATMQWWRIRESGGTTYWEYAATYNGTYTVLFSTANPIDLSDILLEFSAGIWQAESANITVKFDNFNTDGVVVTPPNKGAFLQFFL